MSEYIYQLYEAKNQSNINAFSADATFSIKFYNFGIIAYFTMST